MYIMSKTKKYARRRRKNKTKKSRMMKGGTITHNSDENKFKPKNNSRGNIEQARFFNIVLPQYLGIAPNNANALIDYLKSKGLHNLTGNKITSNGREVANISTPENLLKLKNIISARNDELLTNEGSDSSQKLQPVIDSLETQNRERAESKSDEGHVHYHDKIIQLVKEVRALRGIDEEAGQGQKSIDDQMMDMSQFSAFAPPSVSSASSSSSSSASSKGCSSVVVSLPNNSIIGMVIGKKGTNIKKIQRDTNTYITTVKGDFVDFTVNYTSNADPSDVEGAAKILRNYYNITLTLIKVPLHVLKNYNI